jgi:hypothetical protein
MRRRSSSKELVRVPPSQPVAPTDPALNAQIADAERPGLVAAARINAAGFAASVGAHNALRLSQLVDLATKVSPAGDLVYREILMAYGTVAVGELQRLGFHEGGQR